MNTEWRRLGKYELRERLASGGQGVVWKAFDTQLQRFVAIKQLNAHLHEDVDFVARFELEARFIASLRHPNIVQIHDFLFHRASGSSISLAYMVMDYIEGPTLADYIRSTSRKGQYPPASDVVSLFTAISLALDYAHQRGMIHRDIKPANILLDQRNSHGKPTGEPILTDFGIAKAQGSLAETTRVLGTPLYVSPEQAQGLSGDERSDLYSLGIVLYEVMTGFPPFRSDSVMALLNQHAHAIPRFPDNFNPHIAPNVSAVILKSIAKDPDARFSSASAMTVALAEALNVPIPSVLRRAGTSPAPTNPFMVNEANVSDSLFASTLPSSRSPQSPVVASPLAFVSSANDKQTPAIQRSGKRPRKRLYVALIILLAILGVGLASYALLAPKTSAVSSTVVGQVHFRSSQNKAGDFDVVEMTLSQSIPDDVPDGKSYAAWLESHDFSSVSVHWSFTIRNGSLDPSSYTDPQHQNLFAPPLYRFLITRQNGSSVVPAFNSSDRLYYALIPQTKSAVDQYSVAHDLVFDIRPCPQSDDANNPCMP
jgi:eukaryotic-like serine/threonine-protein kinase